MIFQIEVSEEEYLFGLHKGWNIEYDEELKEEDFGLPDIGDLSGTPHASDLALAYPYMLPSSVKRIA